MKDQQVFFVVSTVQMHRDVDYDLKYSQLDLRHNATSAATTIKRGEGDCTTKKQKGECA